MIRELPKLESHMWVGHANASGTVEQVVEMSHRMAQYTFGHAVTPLGEFGPERGRKVWEALACADDQQLFQKLAASCMTLGKVTSHLFQQDNLRVHVELTPSEGFGYDFWIRQVKCPFSGETARVIRKLMTSGIAVGQTIKVPEGRMIKTSQHIKHVADELGVAPTTVRRHLQIAKRQAGCSNMSTFQFGAFCILNGLVDLCSQDVPTTASAIASQANT